MLKNLTCFFILTSLVFSVEALSSFYPTTPTQGKIIFVTGSCSSGKSSMAKIVAQKLNAKIFAFDEYVMPIVLKKFVKKHYGSFLAFFINGLVMRNFFTAVNLLSEKRKYALQKDFYEDLKQGLAIEPTSRMYREVKKVALQGQNVVVESPLYLWEGADCLSSLPELNDMDVTYVLAYCPWDDLVSRIKQRNSSKNKKMHRELDWALINFMHSLEISANNHGQSYLECLNGDNVHKVITKYAQPKYKKRRMRLLAETQQIASQKFPQNTDYYVYPRFEYNVTVNTKVNAPEQGACLVMDYLQGKKQI